MASYQSLHDELFRQLEEIRERQGELTPEAVLADVEKTGRKHPLYSKFEWDNKIAGRQHRLGEAHRLIVKVKVRFTDANDEERSTRRYVAVTRPTAHQPDYERVEDVVLDPLKRRIVLQEAERRWKTLRSQYGHLAEFANMILSDLHDEAG